MFPDIVAEKMERWQRNNNHSLNKINNLLSKVDSNNPDLWREKDMDLHDIV